MLQLGVCYHNRIMCPIQSSQGRERKNAEGFENEECNQFMSFFQLNDYLHISLFLLCCCIVLLCEMPKSLISTLKEKISRSRSSDSIIASPDHRNKDIADQEYYHGLLPRHDTDLLLTKEGDFLIRKSEVNGKETLVLSIQSKQGMRHYPIIQNEQENMCWIEDGRKFASVSMMIDCYYMSRAPISTSQQGASTVMLRYAVPRQQWELRHEHIFLADLLGAGNFAEVYKAVLLIDDTRYQWVAVKKLHSDAVDKEERSNFMTEARLLRNLSDEHIVRMIGIAAEREPLMIVMEWMAGGTLLDCLRDNKCNLSLLRLTELCVQSSQGMRYLEKEQCIHRDLAARNCLLDIKGDLKIADFGLGIEGRHHKQKGELKVAIKWMAPEYLKHKTCSSKSDVWSFGILMFEIFSRGEEPYKDWDCSETYGKVVHQQYRMSPPSGMPSKINEIMVSCLEYKPQNRPTFLMIKKKLYRRRDDVVAGLIK